MTVDLRAPTRPDVAPIQRRTLRLLFVTQIIGGVGVAIGISVGALLAARVAGTAVAGLAQSCGVVGAALLAVPVTRIMNGHGRRPGLVVAYLVGAVGALLVVLATVTGGVPLLFLGMLLFGGGTAANLQARYTAVDLAEPARRGRQLSLVVWATTIGSVAAPNFAALADGLTRGWGLPRCPARSRSAPSRSAWRRSYCCCCCGRIRCSPRGGSRRPTPGTAGGRGRRVAGDGHRAGRRAGSACGRPGGWSVGDRPPGSALPPSRSATW